MGTKNCWRCVWCGPREKDGARWCEEEPPDINTAFWRAEVGAGVDKMPPRDTPPCPGFGEREDDRDG